MEVRIFLSPGVLRRLRQEQANSKQSTQDLIESVILDGLKHRDAKEEVVNDWIN